MTDPPRASTRRPNKPALAFALSAATLALACGRNQVFFPPPDCALTALPNPLTFGNVGLNQSLTEQVTVTNEGGLACAISGVGLGAGTDPLFTLAAPLGSATLQSGASLSLSVTFDASVSTSPFLHTGDLVFASTDPQNPKFDIPLQAYVSTACSVASQWIYTVDINGSFARFDPTTLTFTTLGMLDCADSSGPFSMAVDQNAVAWVEFQDGQLFQVDTTTAGCTPTAFQPDQENLANFGMGFVFDPNSGVDTLFVAGGPVYPAPSSTLATIALPALVLSTVAPLTFGFPELSGTGDGQLWGFSAAQETATDVPTLAQIDPATGVVLQSFTYDTLSGGNFAMKFWGGSFWIFLGNSVFQVARDTGRLTTALDGSAPEVVGAGVSTCAPVQ